MLINNHELAKLIKKDYAKNTTIKDILYILESEQEVILGALREGHTVKIGKLYKIYPKHLESRTHYDGIHHKRINLPDRTVIKEMQLSDIKKLYN